MQKNDHIKMSPAIVVIGYDRADSLKRLLGSIAEAQYPHDDITLIISLDKSGKADVEQTAKSFIWKHGEKKVVVRPERMGLKKHILTCGNYADEYGSIIMLEDDLYVSPDFYLFAEAALTATSRDPKVGGVSLYNHRFNVFARLPFEAVDDGYDNWYFQFASSWGQAWTKEQWDGFRDWQMSHDGEDLHDPGMPKDVAEWGDSSWLKYAIRYLVDTDKYFLYPRISETTNFADVGVHASGSVTDLQVPMRAVHRGEYIFSTVEQSRARYDAYFENIDLPHPSDLYGLKYRDGAVGKNTQDTFIFSTDRLPYETVDSYGLDLRPIDANILYRTTGRRIFLYDLSQPKKNVKERHGALERYFYPGMNRKKIMNLIREGFGL